MPSGQQVEDAAIKFWDEIAAESETKAKVVEIFKKYNADMQRPAGPYTATADPRNDFGRGAARAPVSRHGIRACAVERKHHAAMLPFDALKAAASGGTIDTVLTCMVDMQGRLMGKRFHVSRTSSKAATRKPIAATTCWPPTSKWRRRTVMPRPAGRRAMAIM
jgi:hypothetical protein